PHGPRQAECIRLALERAGLTPEDISIINTHATGTKQGDVEECKALAEVFAGCSAVRSNNTKSIIGHAMGAAGVLELAANLSSFEDNFVHPTINLDNPDPACALPGLVAGKAEKVEQVETILNNSFGMVGINSVVIIKRFMAD
ncbi:beta-ketoacyl-[acyl-carrier-protein] synthase family protein, partial [Desulfobulbus sp. N3]|nr:beta-ketoacyl-[acyl-carrier-protein] synthase family protein [Desulfobulbus sp. N3]